MAKVILTLFLFLALIANPAFEAKAALRCGPLSAASAGSTSPVEQITSCCDQKDAKVCRVCCAMGCCATIAILERCGFRMPYTYSSAPLVPSLLQRFDGSNPDGFDRPPKQ